MEKGGFIPEKKGVKTPLIRGFWEKIARFAAFLPFSALWKAQKDTSGIGSKGVWNPPPPKLPFSFAGNVVSLLRPLVPFRAVGLS